MGEDFSQFGHPLRDKLCFINDKVDLLPHVPG